MSHFTVMVVLPEQPTTENQLLAKALQPFHEFECTGTDEEFVQNVDKMPEAMEEFEEATSTLIIQRPDGTKFNAFADGEYCEEMQPFLFVDGMGRKKLNMEAGWAELRNEPAKDHEGFAEWEAEVTKRVQNSRTITGLSWLTATSDHLNRGGRSDPARPQQRENNDLPLPISRFE